MSATLSSSPSKTVETRSPWVDLQAAAEALATATATMKLPATEAYIQGLNLHPGPVIPHFPVRLSQLYHYQSIILH